MAVASGQDGRAGRTRGEAVYQGLRRAIIEAALRPGTKLPEDAVGESFGVSRTVVRSVLARLAGEGLVTQQVNRRAAVAAPTLEDARDLFRVRRGLERTVVEILAGRLTKDQVARLVDHVGAERAVEGRDGPASIRLAGEFHTLLAEMTGNEILCRYVNEVVSRGSLVLAIYGRPHSSDCAVNEHRELIAALAEGKPSIARGYLDAIADTNPGNPSLAGLRERMPRKALCAASCSATFLLTPRPVPRTSPPMCTSAT